MLHAWKQWGEAAAAAEFQATYDRKQRAQKKPDFKRVVRGKLEFIGFVKGRDDAIFLSLIERYAKLDSDAKIRPVTATTRATDNILFQALWLLEGDGSDGNHGQATAFAVEGYGLITAGHSLEGTVHASRPHIDPGKKFAFTVVRKDEHHDIAQIKVSTRIPVQLRIGPDDKLAQGQQIRLLGFPSYHVGDGVAISAGPITQERMYSGVKHFVIEPHIVRGNSGGPVLDRENRVVGVAIKGQGTPGRFSQYDELSSFVPISALEQMK